MMMNEEYNPVSRQNSISAGSCSLQIARVMTNEQSCADSLEELHDEITKHTPEGTKHCKDEKYRVEFLQMQELDTIG